LYSGRLVVYDMLMCMQSSFATGLEVIEH